MPMTCQECLDRRRKYGGEEGRKGEEIQVQTVGLELNF